MPKLLTRDTESPQILPLWNIEDGSSATGNVDRFERVHEWGTIEIDAVDVATLGDDLITYDLALVALNPRWDESEAPALSDEVVNIGLKDDTNDVSLVSERLTKDVLALLDLNPGWDGAGAPAVSDKVVKYGLKVFAEFCVPKAILPAVVPTTGGGMQFEWHTHAYHIELEFDEPGRFSLYVERRDREDEDPYFAEFAGTGVLEARVVLIDVLRA